MRPRAPERRAAFLAAALLLGCGDGVRTAAPGECDPVEDRGCPGGEHCRLVAGGTTACLAPTPGVAAGCTPASCPPGASCLRIEGVVGCRPLCRVDDGDGCPDPTRCAYELGAASAWGACVERCDPRRPCPDAESTCAPSDAAGFAVCVAAGPVPEGALCGAERCAAGLACLRGAEGAARCHRLCDPAIPLDCPSGSRCEGRIPGEPEFGFCAPPAAGP